MNKRCFVMIVALCSLLLLAYGCGEDKVTPPTAEELIKQGWAKFGAGDNAGASGDFNAALGLNLQANDYEAYFGLGWVELTMSHAGLAEEAFETYLDRASSDPIDAKAGLALAYHAQDKFDDAIDAAEEVLSANPTWSFSRAPEVDYLDVALVLAHSYYQTADFTESLQVVQDYFDSGFSVDTSTPEGRGQLADKLKDLYTG
ncbi:MAG: tetratricopeptide repeat protein [Candidatus Zixiibacteriota bacterium]